MMKNNKGIFIGIVVVLIILGAVAVLSGHYAPTSTTTSSSGQQAPVLLTDPAVVPTGTTALVVTYSSLKVHTSGASGTGWVDASGNGTINLLNLVNTTELIGKASISANSTIDMISFNVTSATIMINGTTSNVTLPNHVITAHITGNSKVNATSGVLLDLSPTIAAIYTSNSTIFVMVPSVRAIVIGARNVSISSSVGTRETLNASDRKDLEDIRSNISIVSSSVSFSGNSTDVTVTVKDNSNSSVVLKHVLIFGNYSVAVAPLAGFNTTVHIGDNGGISENNGNAGEGNGNIVSENGTVKLNITNTLKGSRDHSSNSSHSGDPAGNASSDHSSPESDLISQGIETQHLRMFNFMINQNGTMSLPSLGGEAEGSALGYNLAAGSTATFNFIGSLSFGEGHITISPAAGSQYNIVVSGENGARASVNVTAS
jgi:hypothetical protein